MTQTDTEHTDIENTDVENTDTEDSFPLPAFLDEVREVVRSSPNERMAMADPAWSGEGSPPDWALLGELQTDGDGEIVQWDYNEKYRPSPGMLGWPEPEDEVDRAVQRAVTGYGPLDDIVAALAAIPEVAVHTRSDGELVTSATPDGAAVVAMYSSPGYLRAAGPMLYETVALNDLIERLPVGHDLYINPTGPASIRLEGEVLEAVKAKAASMSDETPTSTPSEPVVTTSTEPALTSGEAAAVPLRQAAADTPADPPAADEPVDTYAIELARALIGGPEDIGPASSNS